MPSFLSRPLRYRYFNATIILVVVNALVFVAGFARLQNLIVGYLGLTSDFVLHYNAWWQVFTYMFVHGDFFHILFNMISLLVIGIQLEQRMGSTEYLLYYLLCGTLAGLATVFINQAAGRGADDVIGASGAIYALLLAFASFFPDARLAIWGIIPVRAPVLLGIYLVIDIGSQFRYGFNSGVAHMTHLSGLLFGYLYLLVRFRMNPIAIFFRRH
jgi:membrane associated rhomboid family serine protease